MDNNKIVRFKSRLKIFFRIFKKAFIRFRNNQGILISNGLAFKTVIVFIPILILIVYIFKIIPPFSMYKEKLVDFLRDFIVPSSVELVVSRVDILFEKTGTISIISFIVFAYFLLELLISLNNQIDRIWGIKYKRSIIGKVLKFWMLLTTIPMVLAGYFYYSGIIRSFLKVLPFMNISILENIIYYLVSIILISFFFFIIYFIIPTSKVNFKKSIIVTFSVTAVWIVLRFIFTYYTVWLIRRWSFVFGSFVSIIIFVIWTSINWMVVLFGVEILCVWQNKLFTENIFFDKVFLFDIGFILLILNEFYNDFKKEGKGISSFNLAEKLHYNQNDIKKIIIILEEEGFLIGNNKSIERFFLKRDISAIKLAEIEKIIWKRLLNIQNNTSNKIKKYCKELGKYYLKRKEDSPVYIDYFMMD